MEKLKDLKGGVPVSIVAKILGKTEQYVRIGLQQQRLPIGSAVKTSSQWTYHISYELLKNYIGIDRIEAYEKKCAE